MRTRAVIEKVCFVLLGSLVVTLIVLTGIIATTPTATEDVDVVTSEGTSPGVTIEAEGYVVDYPDMPGQLYIEQEDGTITIIYER